MFLDIYGMNYLGHHDENEIFQVKEVLLLFLKKINLIKQYNEGTNE